MVELMIEGVRTGGNGKRAMVTRFEISRPAVFTKTVACSIVPLPASGKFFCGM